MKKEKEIFTFHRFKVKQGQKEEKHPKLIVDYNDGFYGHMGLTKSPKKGKHHRNIPLKINPQKNNSKPAYLRKKIEYDAEQKFVEKPLKDYVLSKQDKNYIVEYVNKHKKR